MPDNEFFYSDPIEEILLESYQDEEYFNGQCVEQVIKEIGYSCAKIQLATLCYGLVRYLPRKFNFAVSTNFIVTHVLLYQFSSNPFTAMAIFNTFTMVSFLTTFKMSWSGFRVTLLNIVLLVLTQSYFGNTYFLSVRGILMLHAMRLSTLAFESEKGSCDLSGMDCIEYVYHAPTIIFGPYTTVRDFKIMQNPRKFQLDKELVKTVGKTLLYTYFSFVAVLFSSCFTDLAVNYFESSLVLDYWDAFSFRTGHYFVSYFGQSIITALGSDFTVINALDIEFPRSVVEIVSCWNRPMHTFLKNYIFSSDVFKTMPSKVFFTFSVSSLLHGIDYQMTMTLLTLGFIAYCEDCIRRKLALLISCCVKAKKCGRCDHRWKENSFLAINFNLIFAMLAIYHLIFTGMTFIDFYAPDGYPISHTIETWGSHYFSSFFISFLLLGISKYF